MMETSKKKRKSLIDQFCSVTGAATDVGQQLLEACDGNLELAIEMHMEGGDQSGTGASPQLDEVRAPIPQTQEVLIDDAPAYAANFRGRKRKNRSVFDGFRDFQEETRQQEEQMMAGASGSKTSRKTKTLQDLFRPPIDMTFKGTFANARDTGKTQGRWVMVNIQNVQEFSCQALNRDVWSNAAVKAVIKDNFIFWQVYHDSDEGEKYRQFYKVDKWPYIAVIDPQTGENMCDWSCREPTIFCDLVTQFLSQHPTASSLSPPAKRVRREASIVDATEDDQLELAIKASLTQNPSTSVTEDSESDCYSELETFSDSDESLQPSPAKTRRTSESPTRSLRNGSLSPNIRCSPRRNSSEKVLRKNEKDNSPKPKGVRCESPLASGSNTPTQRCRRNSSPQANMQNTSQKQKSLFNNNTSPAGDTAGKVKKLENAQNNIQKDGVHRCNKVVNESGTSHASENVSENNKTCDDKKSLKKDTSVGNVTDNRDYRDYLGKDSDEKATLMLRLPNGQREKLCIPFSSKLLAVVLFVGSKGFSNERYELVAHFPHRQLSQLDYDATLTDIQLHAQETIFVQART